MQPDTFGVYVRRRLDHWGSVFALSRDCEYLGHASKNMLQVLIDHKGEIPPPNVGYKPLEIDQDAMQIEMIVTDIAREQIRMACVMRAYWCGEGRRKVERYETALMLIAEAESGLRNTPKLPNVQRYLSLVDIGFAQVRGVLTGISRAA